MEEERLYWLAFSAFEGIGSRRFALLKNYFGSAKEAWEASRQELLATGLGPKLVSKLAEFRKTFRVESYLKDLQKREIGCLFLDRGDYPENLKKIDDPPFVLYWRGGLKTKDSLALAVVGTRKMTAYGSQVAEKLTAALVRKGLTIVSGLARGIDSVAHKAALAARGRTIGVLGSGLARIYPAENKGLVEAIVQGKGAVISEYPPEREPRPGNFPARNRIIAGLSLGVLVVEGGEKSGSLITARLAAEQGREIFAVPGPIWSPGSFGPGHLVKLGAKLVLRVEDILEELQLEKKTEGRRGPKAESGEEEMILSLIEGEPKEIEEIVRESGWETGRVMSLLTMMELKGKIKNLEGTRYGV